LRYRCVAQLLEEVRVASLQTSEVFKTSEVWRIL